MFALLAVAVPHMAINVYNTYLLSNEVNTFKNAMTWGIFKEHCDQVQHGKLSNGAKCFHVTMGALEFLPVLSQLISLIEYCVNKIFKLEYS